MAIMTLTNLFTHGEENDAGEHSAAYKSSKQFIAKLVSLQVPFTAYFASD